METFVPYQQLQLAEPSPPLQLAEHSVEAQLEQHRSAWLRDIVKTVDEYGQNLASPENSQQREHIAHSADHFLWVSGFESAMSVASQNPDDLAMVLDAANRLEAKIGGSIMHNFMGSAFYERNGNSFHELVRRQDNSLGSILKRMVEGPLGQGQHFDNTFVLVEKILASVLGEAMQWKTNKQLPEFVQKIANSPQFPRAYLRLEAWRLQQPELARDPNKQYWKTRVFEEQFLKDVLQLDPTLVKEYRFAMQARTMKKDAKDRVLAFHERGGIDFKDWTEAMGRATHNIQSIGAEAAHMLREEFGIVNFDRYTPAQLTRMKMIAESDPKTFGTLSWQQQAEIESLLRALREGNVALNVNAAFGDYNNALGLQEIYDNNGFSLFAEVTGLSPAAFYKPLIKLATKFGIKSSTLVLGTHGFSRGMEFKTVGNRQVQIGPSGAELLTSARTVNIEKTQIKKVISKYMQADKNTGNKYLFLHSCSQGKNTWVSSSTAYTILKESDPKDNLVISTSKEPFGVGKWDTGVALIHFLKGTSAWAKTNVFSRNKNGKIKQTKEDTVRGLA